MDKKDIGIVETKYFTFKNFVLENEQILPEVTIAYETYGTLNEQKNNAVLITHAFTGDAHCAGYHQGDKKPGWWNTMVGPGKAFNTDKYFVIASNVLGGCAGTTGPASINPVTGVEYGTDFPEFIYSAIPIAATLRSTPQQIAFNEVGRQSIMGDVEWKKGHYYGGKEPDKGLAVARMLGHITYMSDYSMQKKFPVKNPEPNENFDFNADFEVEEYLRYRGSSFVKRFDANSYLYLSKAIDYFDVQKDNFLPEEKNFDIKFLVISFKSDWLYPPYQSENIVKHLKMKGQEVTYCNIYSTYGHDAFLLEVKDETNLIKNFLNNLYEEVFESGSK